MEAKKCLIVRHVIILQVMFVSNLHPPWALAFKGRSIPICVELTDAKKKKKKKTTFSGSEAIVQ